MVFINLSLVTFSTFLSFVVAETSLRTRVLTDPTRECPTEPTVFQCYLENLTTGMKVPVPDSYQVEADDTFSIVCETNALGPVVYTFGQDVKTEDKAPFYMAGNSATDGPVAVPDLVDCDAVPFKVGIEFKAGNQLCATTEFNLSPKCAECGCPANAVPKDGVSCPTTIDECKCKYGFVLHGDSCVCPDGYYQQGDYCKKKWSYYYYKCYSYWNSWH